MILADDRTEEVKNRPHLIVLGTDRFMSGWGMAEGGPSYAGWACDPGHVNAVESWVRQRGDQLRVRIVGPDYRPPGGPGHCHIYVHESLKPFKLQPQDPSRSRYNP
jgi:hypothetical protein